MPSTRRPTASERIFSGQTERYDAVVLDLGLPKVDGLTVLRRWREAGLAMPVLLLTARGSWHEKVQGIDSGADDYVSKPFRIEEVLARLRALIRRASGQVTPLLRSGPVLLDPRSAKVTVEGVPVKLTGHEFRVLSYLMHHRGRVVSQAELSEHIYAQDLDRDSNTVEVFIARLRRKLGTVVHRDRSRTRVSNRGGTMIGLRSLRSRLLLAAFLWTVGLFAAGVQVSTEIMLRYERFPMLLHGPAIYHARLADRIRYRLHGSRALADAPWRRADRSAARTAACGSRTARPGGSRATTPPKSSRSSTISTRCWIIASAQWRAPWRRPATWRTG